MDEVSITLLDRLVDKTFENMSQEERLTFVEKLFSDLPAATQQEFLLRLAQRVSDAGSGSRGHQPIMMMMEQGPNEFGPWQMCCMAMNDLVASPDFTRADTGGIMRTFNALADETRLKIVKLLVEHERSVDEIVTVLGIAQSTTSHHLRVLKDAHLISADKRGRKVFYALTEPVIEMELAG